MTDRATLGEVIAEREVVFTRDTGQTETFKIRIGKPVVGDSPEEWRCPYQIEGLGRTKTLAMSGVDSVQALVLTLQVILPELDHIAKREHGKFAWLEDPNSGFPDYRLSPSYKEPK
jgi:hypothetical protein